MVVKLRILNVKYNQRGMYTDDAWYKGDLSKAKLIKKKINLQKIWTGVNNNRLKKPLRLRLNYIVIFSI